MQKIMGDAIMPSHASFANNEPFHFVFASDEKFTVQLQVAILSLVKASFGKRNLQHIHVLDCGISDDTWSKISLRVYSLAKRYSVCVEISRHNIDMSLFGRFKDWNTSKATYARLLLPDLLPDVRYCVYSDGDMLFFKNPWELVEQLTYKGVAILGHKNSIDGGFTNPDERWFSYVNEPYNRDTYFCAGLVAMDLDKFRALGAVERMLDFLARHPDSVTADQPALNWFFRNDSSLEEGGWGIFPIECFGDNYEIKAIHYAGGTPWKNCDSWYKYLIMRQQDELWYDFAAKILGGEVTKRKTLLAARVLGRIAFLVTFAIVKFRLTLPSKERYLRLFDDMLHKHSQYDSAQMKLMADID